MPADARLEKAARDVHGAVDRALVELVGLADVDEHGRLVGGQARGSVGGADLVDLRLHLCKKILVAGHVRANATCIAPIPSRLPCARGRPDRQEARRCRSRSRASLVVAVAVLGALALRSPGARRGAPLVGSAARRAAARARSPGQARAAARRRSPRSPPTCAPAAARRPRRPCGARARCSARAICASRSPGALLRYRPGEVDTAIGVLRALAANDDRAPVPALHLGLALLWSGQRAEATAELEQTRLIDPDGLYGTHRRRRPAPVVPQGLSAVAELAARARLARAAARAGRGRAALAARPSSTTPTACSSARARARALVAERALALDATNIDAQVAVIVLGFDKDVPAQAVGRLAQLMQSRRGRAQPALPLRRAALVDRPGGQGQGASTGRPRRSTRRA